MRRILNLIRFVFLLLSLLGVASFYVWNERPQLVQKAHGYMRGETLERFKVLERRLKLAEAEGDFEGVMSHATRLEEMTSDVKLGDRASRQRRLALESLVAENRRRGDLRTALEWADELHDFEPRNFPAEIARAELLGDLGLTEDSEALIQKLMKVAEDSPSTRLVVARSLVRQGDADAVIEFLGEERNIGLLRPKLERSMVWSRGPQKKWEVGYEVEFTPGPDGRYHYAHEFDDGPHDVQFVRVDLPVGAEMSIRDLRATIERPGIAEPIVLDLEHVVHANHLQRDGDALIATGKLDPYVTMQSPDMLKATSIEFSMTVIPHLGVPLTEFLASDAAKEAYERKAADLDPWARLQLQRVIDEASN